MNLNSWRFGKSDNVVLQYPSGCRRRGVLLGIQSLNEPATNTALASGARQEKLTDLADESFALSFSVFFIYMSFMEPAGGRSSSGGLGW